MKNKIVLIIVIIVIVIIVIYSCKELYHNKELYYNMNNIIDTVLYINIDNRKDRKLSIESQCKQYNLKTKRIDSILFKNNGTKGCALSHCKMLENAILSSSKNCLFLEDDNIICVSSKKFYINIKNFLDKYKNNWDVLMLCGNCVESIYTEYSNIKKVKKSLSSNAYFVNNHYYKTLLKSFQKSADNLFDYNDNKNIKTFAPDVTWFELQKKDRWYIIEPLICKQDISFSNITNRIDNYHNMNYILCCLNGRLGNQLFEIANCYYLSKKYGKYLIVSYDNDNHKDNYLNKIFHNLNIKLESKSKHISIHEKNFHYTPIILDYDKNYSISGYFQSELYFYNIKEFINDLFYLDKDDNDLLLELYNKYTLHFKNEKKIISIHIRRTDYINNPILCVLPISYYKKCIDYFGADCNYLIFSDDIKWCKENILINSLINKEFVQEKDYLELFLMSKCDHNIIANSTFSWWGAYLNKNPKKEVLYPNQWFTLNTIECNNNTICPTSWKKIYITDITIVTEYFKIETSKHNNDKNNLYYEWMKNVLHINYPMVIYIFKNDIQTKNNIIKYRIDKLEITEIKEINIEDFYVYKYFDLFNNYQNNINPSNDIHNPFLSMIWNEKCSCVNKVIQENIFNSDIYMWIDIGYIRKIKNIHFYNNIQIQKIPKNEVLIQSIINDNNTANSNKNIKNIMVDGGLFIGYKKPMIKYIKDFYKILNEKIDNTFIRDDEIIHSYINNNVKYIHKNEWFYIFWYLNSKK